MGRTKGVGGGLWGGKQKDFVSPGGGPLQFSWLVKGGPLTKFPDGGGSWQSPKYGVPHEPGKTPWPPGETHVWDSGNASGGLAGGVWGPLGAPGENVRNPGVSEPFFGAGPFVLVGCFVGWQKGGPGSASSAFPGRVPPSDPPGENLFVYHRKKDGAPGLTPGAPTRCHWGVEKRLGAGNAEGKKGAGGGGVRCGKHPGKKLPGPKGKRAA
ncbi:M-phase-specific PLK1-interacting protein-like [Homalodisca vitripennis]|uniref:M-phase-specific PLK1-interacting protein-like n=1 Tax=Homalodisca vitripennis TaxID=197043 RepID=UPI001EEBDC64|nr:M-phase-specific PLK1-interacting protein-like [Homalodisca vitripennis]